MAVICMDVDIALAEVPINLLPAIDDTDFKTIEDGLVYNQPGLDLVWNFVTTAGVQTQTEVTPTSGGDYDPTNQGNGIYSLEIPASGGASINNDTEGHGWFSGVCTGVLPWRGPVICFRASGLNNILIDSAYSATRGLAGTAIPDAVSDAAGGLAISDAGGLDLDSKLANTNEITVARMGALTDWINGGRLDLLLDAIPTLTEMTNAFTEIKGATWSASSDTLEHIRNAIVDANPQNHSATANTETTGTLDAGTYADTASINAVYYQTSPVTPAVGGFGLNVSLTFNIGTGRVAEQLEVTAYFNSGALRTVQVWAYDYNQASYVQLSSSVNDFGNSVSNETFQYPLTNNMRQASDGEVKIRFTSESVTTTDDFYCDAVTVSSVAQEAAGLTADAIQAAVWARAHVGHDEETLGYNLSKLFIQNGHIVSATDAKTFVIDYDIPVEVDMAGMLIMLEDKTDDRYEIRRIVSTDAATDTVVVDRNFSFTPAALDDWYFLGQGYSDVNVTHVAGTSQTANDNGADINLILDDTNELQTNQGNWLTATSVTVSDKTGFSLSTAGIAAIWNALTSGMTTVGSLGKKLADWVVGTIDTYTGNTKQTADHTSAISTVQDDLDKITGADGATLATLQALYAPNKVVPDVAGTAATPADVDQSLTDLLATTIDGTVTIQHALMIFLSALAGKSDGAQTALQHFRDPADLKNRITSVVDSSGNRTSITLDLT